MVSKWNKDGSLIATAGAQNTVEVWMPSSPGKSEQKVKVLRQEDNIVDLDWQNSTDFASCSLDMNIHLWSISQDNPLRVWRGHQGNLTTIKWDPAGSLLASCAEDDVVYLWSPKQNEAVKALKGH